MWLYALKRMVFLFPTLLGIVFLNFLIVQLAPGGPVEQMIAEFEGTSVSSMARLTGGDQVHITSGQGSSYEGSHGLSPEMIREIEKMYGFDKPFFERFWLMLKNYLTFDFGKSYFQQQSVMDLVLSRFPVSLSLGLWSTLIIYSISITLGIKKAVRAGTPFDVWTSSMMIIGYAIPSFLFAIFLIVFFAGGSFFSLFPLRGLTSSGWETMSMFERIVDYIWHMALPVIAQVIGGFATLTLLTKNSFLEEASKQYVITARSKGIQEKRILIKHIFRNALLVIVASLPSKLLHIFFASSLLIEVIFSLDGLGVLGFNAAITRDYPVVFGTLYVFTLFGLVLHILSDLLYTWVDPRIDFRAQGE